MGFMSAYIQFNFDDIFGFKSFVLLSLSRIPFEINMIKLSTRRFAVVLFFQCLVLLIDLVRHTTLKQRVIVFSFSLVGETLKNALYQHFRPSTVFLIWQETADRQSFFYFCKFNPEKLPFSLEHIHFHVVIFYSFQDICLVLAFTVLLFSLYSTYVFQVSERSQTKVKCDFFE